MISIAAFGSLVGSVSIAAEDAVSNYGGVEVTRAKAKPFKKFPAFEMLAPVPAGLENAGVAILVRCTIFVENKGRPIAGLKGTYEAELVRPGGARTKDDSAFGTRGRFVTMVNGVGQIEYEIPAEMLASVRGDSVGWAYTRVKLRSKKGDRATAICEASTRFQAAR